MQPFSLALYTWSFVTILAGTVMFVIVSRSSRSRRHGRDPRREPAQGLRRLRRGARIRRFTVDDGEFFVLLGPVGLRQDDDAAHDRRARAADLAAASCSTARTSPSSAPRERDIAFVFQLFALYPHMNVRKNIAFPLLSPGHAARRDRRQRVEETARLLRIDHLLDQPVSRPVRRRPPARGARPRHRAPADGLPDGRAARRARRRVPRPDVRELRACTTASTRPPSTSPTTSSRRWRWPTRSR